MIDNDSLVINSAVWTQTRAFQVGTGNLNPFLRIQDAGDEEGFNSDGAAQLDADASWTKSLSLNHVPVITVAGNSYREIVFDANEENSAPDGFFSIDQFNLHLCDDTNAPLFDARSDFESNVNCDEVYNLAGKVILATDDLSSGSGSGYDYRILIPEELFEIAAGAVGVSTTADCSYNGSTSASCGVYLILDAKMGYTKRGCVEDPGETSCFITGATFEEFSTIKRPWVSVTKTAVPSFKRRQLWQISKTVSPTTITQFVGQSTDATWTITATPNGTQDFDAVISGTITIANTSGDPATVLTLADAIPGYPAITPSCPGITFPAVLADKGTIQCTYSVTPPDTDAGVHTNTATVTVEAAIEDDDPTEPSVFQGTANFDFANATPSETIDQNPNVYDNAEGGAGAPTTTLKGTASQSPIQYTLPYACGATRTVIDVARLDLAPTGDATGDPTDDATLQVNCLTLTVDKTAATTVNRNFLWTIDKTVTPSSWNLFNGDNGTSRYTITVSPNGFEDTGLTVTGDITITNPNSLPVYLQSLPTDVLTGPLAATVTCPKVGTATTFPHTLEAGQSLVCSYTRGLPDGTTRNNIATVTAKPTPTGTNKDFADTLSVNPASATPTETNKTVNVTDNFNSEGAVSLGTATWGTGTTPGSPTVFNPTKQFACPANSGTFNNTATITETGQSDGASVVVNCYALTTTKTATPKYAKDWNWSVVKTIDPNDLDLNLAKNEVYQPDYTVTYTSDAGTESNWRVDGTIKVSNTAPIAATINSVTDLIAGGGFAPVPSCGVTFPYTLAAGTVETPAELNCTYSQALPNKDSRTNTATAVRQAYSYTYLLASSNNGTVNYASSAVDIIFPAAPTEASDECVIVDDSQPSGAIVTGTICAGDPPTSKTFTYQHTFDTSVCGPYNLTNIAVATTTSGTSGTLANTDTDSASADTVSVDIDVACLEGCTLTQGYWKTHNESFKGGASKKADPAWLLIGATKELTGFFTNAPPSYPVAGPNTPPFSWFTVFWTAPKGNPYYNLAHQYQAALLNTLNGADDAVVATALGQAQTFLAANGPATNWTKAQKKTMLEWAGIFGSYNEGKTGPGHCDEDNTSDLAIAD